MDPNGYTKMTRSRTWRPGGDRVAVDLAVSETATACA